MVNNMSRKQYFSNRVRADDAVGILSFAEHKNITDEDRARLYKNLYKAIENNEEFRMRMVVCRDTPGVRTYMLHVMREYLGARNMLLSLQESKATVCSKKDDGVPDCARSCFHVDSVEAVDEIAIKNEYEGGAVLQEEDSLSMLKCFIAVMKIQRLSISNYKHLDERVFKCIGEMKSLRGLSVVYGWCNFEPGTFAHLQGLESLAELDVSGNTLKKAVVQEVGKIKNIEKLVMFKVVIEPGVLPPLQGLHLTELSVSVDGLNMDDIAAIGKIGSLKILRIKGSKIEPGALSHLEKLEHLTGIDVFVDKLEKDGTEGIGAVKNLRTLNIKCTKIEPGALSHLAKLEHLSILIVHARKLGIDDIAAIGKIRSLEILDIKHAEIEPGALSHLEKLEHLSKLRVSAGSLSKEDRDVTERLASRKVQVQ